MTQPNFDSKVQDIQRQSENQSQSDNENNDLAMSALEHLSHYFQSAPSQGLAPLPLAKWQPNQVGDSNMVIKANGEWWHEGRPIQRKALVQQFARVLWQEEIEGNLQYFLKTPVQKLTIEVEDAPLLVNQVAIIIENNVAFLEFTTTTGDVVRLDDDHPISLKPFYPSYSSSNQPSSKNDTLENIPTEPDIRPYILIRDNLVALIHRNTFYHLLEIGDLIEEGAASVLILTSGNQQYRVMMSEGE